MSFKLRDYQQEIVDYVYDRAINKCKLIRVMLPTGGGKTKIASTIINRAISKGNKCLFTVPTIDLAYQTAKEFDNKCSIAQGTNDLFNPLHLIQIGTLQTLINREITDVKIVIIDEAHFGSSGDMIASLYNKYKGAIFIEISATPCDAQGNLLDGADAYFDKYQTQDLINRGFLVKPVYYAAGEIDLSDVELKGDDYDTLQIDNKINNDASIKTVVENYKKHCNNKLFICFANSVEHANNIHDAFNKQGYFTAVITATTSKEDRENAYNAMRKGKLVGLINVAVLVAGFDLPAIEVVILATAIGSWRKYIQCCGRGLRTSINKTECIILDCCGNVERHGFCNDRKTLKYKTKFGRVLDKILNVDENNDKRNESSKSNEDELKILKKIGSLLDLYDGKEYLLEKDLQEDVNNFLKLSTCFWYRQNSGKAKIGERYVHFTNVPGLPDSVAFILNTSIYIGIELKLTNGKCTPHQRQTLPEMIKSGILVFFAESVLDVYEILEHVKSNITVNDKEFIINNNIYKLTKRQQQLRRKFLKI